MRVSIFSTRAVLAAESAQSKFPCATTRISLPSEVVILKSRTAAPPKENARANLSENADIAPRGSYFRANLAE